MIPKNNDMRFEVTTKCNYNCVICPREKLTRKLETMSLDLFKQIFDRITSEAPQYDTLTFPGMGEPLLDMGIEEKIAYARSKCPTMPVNILTNGSLLSPERFLRLQDLGVSSIRISLYGHDDESYTRVHGISNHTMYSTLRENMLRICELKTTTSVILTYNIVEGMNDGVFEAWTSFWKDKVDLLEVWRPHNWVDGRDYRAVQGAMLKTCGRPFNGPLQIQVDGTVNMCCFDFDGKLTLGDLKTQSLSEIFSASYYSKLKNCHETGEYAGCGFICEHCDQRNADKSNVAVYNSRFDLKERVHMVSTTYKKVD